MKVKSTCVMLSVLTVGAVAWTGMAGGQVHWGYEGKSGPQYWGDLEPKFRLCSAGKNQSPIDLANFVEADLKPIRFAYKAGSQEILNNGHTVQVNYAAGSSITTEGRVFELKQFHFHAPSENKINGKQFTLEAHLVHADKDDNLAVVAVMFEMGRANSLLAKLWQKIPGNAGDKAATVGHDVSGILPRGRDYYRFNGSLTTPPCSEGVWWLVMKTPVTASKAQVEQISRAIKHPNNRPVQPVNARAILK